jgi:dihydropteroate synthase
LEPVKSINIAGQLTVFDIPKVMGVLNVTPDSFFEGSRVQEIDSIIQTAVKMIDEGVWCIDVGGYSSRPGAEDISLDEEKSRVMEPIRQLRSSFPDLYISVDTFRQEVAEAALEAGANIVNDISGGSLDARMIDFICEAKVPYVAMHMKGSPQTMSRYATYQDLLGDLLIYFSDIAERCYAKGMSDLIMDPGVGFAKTVDQSYHLMSHLMDLKQLGLPLLVGVSRKSFIYKTLGVTASEALIGTIVLNSVALLYGADIVRVHDVLPAVQAIKLIQKTKQNN